MFKFLLLRLSKSELIKNIFLRWNLAKRISKRFVAGETIGDAIETVRRLNTAGYYATIDYLGEQTFTTDDAIFSTNKIVSLIESIKTAQVNANVSIKLSQIGLLLGSDLCKQNLERILFCARETENFIRIDMEGSEITEDTLKLVVWGNSIYRGVGVVVQSYLFRSEKDLETLIANKISIRLVKGAYDEPKSIAFEKKRDVDINFDELTEYIMSNSPPEFINREHKEKFPPFLALGTHDLFRINFGTNVISKMGLPKNALEIQMLFGIRNDLQAKFLKDGFPVRIYVPFGTHWYPYFMRRLAERPANLWFFVTNFFRR